MNGKDLYAKAVDKWGREAQLFMALEEFAEISHAVCKLVRDQGSVAELTDCLADAQVMMEQLSFMFEIPDEKIKEVKEIKLRRLQKLLEGN